MVYESENRTEVSPSRVGLPTFVRIGGAIWLGVIVVAIMAALVAPYAGRLLDLGLHQTLHYSWTEMQLQLDQSFFDLSTPMKTIHSYYSALNRVDSESMARLTDGPFRRQIQQRLTRAEPVFEPSLYRSYVIVEKQSDSRALVLEKFHLFWQRGLRFSLQQVDTEWRIIQVAVVP